MKREPSEIFESAKKEWREQLDEDLNSVWRNIPVETSKRSEAGQPWKFYTDMETLFVELNDESWIETQFEQTVSNYWEGEPEELLEETFKYTLFHELYHPLEAPSSPEDRANIHRAIRRGLLRSDPTMSSKEQLEKVEASSNTVTDFVLNNRLYRDNLQKEWFRKDIVPSCHLASMTGRKSSTNMYTITRHIYGTLYGSDESQTFFSKKASRKDIKVAEGALEKAGIDANLRDPDRRTVQEQVDNLGCKFDEKSSRYETIEDMISVLEPYIENELPESMRDIKNFNNQKSILEDLISDMKENEKNKFLEELIAEEEDEQIGKRARHEYYKENHPEVNLLGKGKEAKKRDRYRREYLKIKKVELIPETRIADLPMHKIERFHKKGLPMLTKTEKDGMYRFIQYETKEEVKNGIEHVETAYEMPDVVEFYLDSSDSMNKSEEFNENTGWEMLSYAMYGIIDAINEAGKRIGERPDMRIHNFARDQVSSGEKDIEEFLDGEEEILNTIYRPENGMTTSGLDFQNYDDDYDRSNIIVTDGDLKSGMATNQASKMEKSIKNGNRTVLIEIGREYNLGEQARKRDVPTLTVDDRNELAQEGLDLLITG